MHPKSAEQGYQNELERRQRKRQLEEPEKPLTQNTLVCCSAGEWGVPGNSSQVSRRALKWTRFLLLGHQLHQDYPPMAGDALPANHQKWPKDSNQHTTSDSSTTPPCHCSQGTKNSQSEALQMPSEQVQKAAPLCWPGRNKTGVSSQHAPKERKKNGGYQHPEWPPRIKRRP